MNGTDTEKERERRKRSKIRGEMEVKERWDQDVDPSQRGRVQGHHSGPSIPSHSH